MQKKIILILLFALVVAAFSIQNAGSVSISILTWHYEVSLAIIVLGAIALGVIIMGLFSSLNQLRLKKEIRHLSKEKEQLSLENRQLKDSLILKQKKQERDNQVNDKGSIVDEKGE